tara:strand:- start:539 stop:898 length:360 start_codon:yes stop_codon:yes gene_type:complete
MSFDKLTVIERNTRWTNDNVKKLVAGGGGAGDASSANQVLMIAELQAINVSTTENNLGVLKKANDLKLTFTYLDPGTDDERVSIIVYSSILDVVTPDVTKTFLYVGGPGTYRVDTITLS